eukprot:GHRR01031641.1.p2 GENE.GHRR01031641.1~~GHRR01031641.1.p2  ORF type:complete len:104 (-),score=24.03 GHRR01031641.1:219-530(-)
MATLCPVAVGSCPWHIPYLSLTSARYCLLSGCPCVQFKVVFDAVYTPRETKLLRDAAATGCLCVDGVAMFVGQAVEQFRLFTGAEEAPVQLMEDVVVGRVTSC